MRKANHKAFTLAEVLITLTVIGIVAAMTIPTMLHKFRLHSEFVQFKKMYTVMLQAFDLAALDYGAGYVPKCAYWGPNSPYSNLNVVTFNREDGEKYWRVQNPDGSLTSLPSDYNGKFSDCTTFSNNFINHLNVIKTCKGNAYRNGCIADVPGNDTLAKERYTGDPDDNEAMEYYTKNATSGMSGFRKNTLLNNSHVYVLSNGSAIIGYGGAFSLRIFAIDTNGLKGPNQWGHDLFYFATYMRPKKNGIVIQGGGYVQTDGATAASMINRINKNSQIYE